MNFHDKKKTVHALKYILKEKFFLIDSLSAWFKYLYKNSQDYWCKMYTK